MTRLAARLSAYGRAFAALAALVDRDAASAATRIGDWWDDTEPAGRVVTVLAVTGFGWLAAWGAVTTLGVFL